MEFNIISYLTLIYMIFEIYCSNFYSEILNDDTPYTSLDDWFYQLNSQYMILNKYSAQFAWELSVNPTEEVLNEASKFASVRANWKNSRCSDGEKLLQQEEQEATMIQKRMINLLCRGPKYTEYQASELSNLFDKIQDIYTETEICLPKSFDLCLNYNRIWDYTYLRTSKDEIIPLDMTKIKPKKDSIDYNMLNVYQQKKEEIAKTTNSDDYYSLRKSNDFDDPFSDSLIRNDKTEMICLSIEPELEKLMTGNFTYLQRNDCALPADVILRWAWESWRLAVGPEIQKSYFNAIYFMNIGAENNGYNDIGETWREELEIPDLRSTIKELWTQVKPFYKLLHAVFRNALSKKFTSPKGKIHQKGPLPAHLLGNMWSQDWSPYHKLLTPFAEIYIDDNFKNTNWTILDMVRRADDFYSSMGMNPMTEKFWKYSNFEKTSNKTKCHGSAANMFDDNDFRILMCAEKTLDDFYVITHEMGHIQYYMHFNHLPAIFQEATNSAFSEALGDSVFLGIMTPQHLNRLGLISDKLLFTEKFKTKLNANEMRIVHEKETNPEFITAPDNDELLSINKLRNKDSAGVDGDGKMDKEIPSYLNSENITILNRLYPNFRKLNEKMRNYMNLKENYNDDEFLNKFDLSLQLRMALAKIPQIPFEYILDIYRWDLFNGKINSENSNDYYWKLIIEEQGIHPPDWEDRHDFFDVASKFHFADNTPYVRYFLASFLQAQIFKGLCEKTLFGKLNAGKKLPMPLHRCDIYGSKRAGNLLKRAMKLGSSKHWSEILFILTGQKTISAEPLLEYYRPLIKWLERIIIEFDIPVGW